MNSIVLILSVNIIYACIYSYPIFCRIASHICCNMLSPYRICPEGFTLGKLEPHHTQYISEYWWPLFAGKPWIAPLMEALITNYDTSAVFVADNPTVPVSWALLWPWGHLAHVYTVEAYRRRGLSTAVQSDLCNKVLANGDTPGAWALPNNEAIIRLLIKQGFIESTQVKMLVHSNSASR